MVRKKKSEGEKNNNGRQENVKLELLDQSILRRISGIKHNNLRVIDDNAKEDLYQLFSQTIFRGQGGKEIVPKGPGQNKYVQAMSESDIVFAVGPAGTGKTYLAMTQAVAELSNEQVSRIILTRQL